MAVNLGLDEDLSAVVSTDQSLDVVVFELILWSQRTGRTLELVRALAHERPNRADLAALASEFEAASSRPQFPPLKPASPRAVSELRVPPKDLRVLIDGFVRLRRILPDGQEKTVLMEEMVTRIRDLPLEEYALTDPLHLSNSVGERLAAIVTLQKLPDPRYLLWLSERLAVEDAFVGYQAAVALYEAARAISFADLDVVTTAVEAGLTWVAPVAGQSGRRDKLTAAMKHLTHRTTGQAVGGSVRL
jgi:hypothetical protein